MSDDGGGSVVENSKATVVVLGSGVVEDNEDTAVVFGSVGVDDNEATVVFGSGLVVVLKMMSQRCLHSTLARARIADLLRANLRILKWRDSKHVIRLCGMEPVSEVTGTGDVWDSHVYTEHIIRPCVMKPLSTKERF